MERVTGTLGRTSMNHGGSSGRVAIYLAIFFVAVIPPAYMIYWLLADNSPVSAVEEKQPGPVQNPAEQEEPAPVMIPVSPALIAGTLEAIWSDSPAEGVSFAAG